MTNQLTTIDQLDQSANRAAAAWAFADNRNRKPVN